MLSQLKEQVKESKDSTNHNDQRITSLSEQFLLGQR